MDNLDRLKSFILSFALIISFLFLFGCSSPSKSNTNLVGKDVSDAGTGGFVWGKNDKKTGLPEEELTNEEILTRQKEVLKRQELEKQRLEKEKQDILRQQQYNQQLQQLQR